jgi:hypothetical protein
MFSSANGGYQATNGWFSGSSSFLFRHPCNLCIIVVVLWLWLCIVYCCLWWLGSSWNRVTKLLCFEKEFLCFEELIASQVQNWIHALQRCDSWWYQAKLQKREFWNYRVTYGWCHNYWFFANSRALPLVWWGQCYTLTSLSTRTPARAS